ncbi:MAG: phenylalanine--tRNA ligase subunit alpha [Thermoplasmata archaeon]
MALEDLAEKLSPGERALLQALADRDGSTAEALVETGAFREEVQVMNAASWLRSKRLLKIRERLIRVYSLRDPAWAERKLPERRALRVLLEVEELPLEDLADQGEFQEEELPIVLGWLKRKGWADIVETEGAPVVRLREEGRLAAEMRGSDELLLERLGEGDLQEGEGDPRVLRQLRQRKEIIRERRRVLRTLHLTERGKRLLAQGLEPVEEVAQLTPELLQTPAWRTKRFRKYDVKAYAPATYAGKKHPLSGYIEKVRRIFLQMGFTEIEGDFVGPAFWSFDALFQPQDHPARDMLDTFYLEEDLSFDLPSPAVLRRVAETHEQGGTTGSTGWGYKWSVQEAKKAVMRPHTTAITIRYLAEHPDPPQKAFIIGKNFRRDAPDPTHLPEFHQIEGVVMEEGANLAMLMGTIGEFYRKMGLPVRFRPGYFPYTEPSLEPEVRLPERWLELGGSGIFRPEVTTPLGITTPVLAWGLGLERLVMALEGLDDLRTLIWNDMDWLKASRSVF